MTDSKPADNGLRWEMWSALLTAQMNELYWQALIHRLTVRDRLIRLLVALISSGAAASIIFTVGSPVAWKWFSGAAAAANIYLTIVDNKKQIEEMSELKRAWAELRVDYETLWRRRRSLDQADIDRFDSVRREEAHRSVHEAKFGIDRKLVRRCQAAVNRARGI